MSKFNIIGVEERRKLDIWISKLKIYIQKLNYIDNSIRDTLDDTIWYEQHSDYYIMKIDDWFLKTSNRMNKLFSKHVILMGTLKSNYLNVIIMCYLFENVKSLHFQQIQYLLEYCPPWKNSPQSNTIFKERIHEESEFPNMAIYFWQFYESYYQYIIPMTKRQTKNRIIALFDASLGSDNTILNPDTITHIVSYLRYSDDVLSEHDINTIIYTV